MLSIWFQEDSDDIQSSLNHCIKYFRKHSLLKFVLFLGLVKNLNISSSTLRLTWGRVLCVHIFQVLARHRWTPSRVSQESWCVLSFCFGQSERQMRKKLYVLQQVINYPAFNSRAPPLTQTPLDSLMKMHIFIILDCCFYYCSFSSVCP